MKFGIRGQFTDIIMCVKLLVDRFRGYGVLTPPKLPFPIDLLRRPYNGMALPCDTVIIKGIAISVLLILGKQEAQLMLTTGSMRLAVSRGQQTWYHSTCYIWFPIVQ